MTATSDIADRDRVTRVIMARCGDVLTEADLAALMQPDLPAEIGAQVLVVVEALERRMNELAALIEAKEDDDGDQRSYRRHA